uniref:WRKY domain-containing protein n=1 Tax=Leersia perrieri TaxID=77586 RepID=A0A0D9UXN6_9ORYZ
MAASLGLCHDTSSYAYSSLYGFPPLMADDVAAVDYNRSSFFPAAESSYCSHHHHHQLPVVLAGGGGNSNEYYYSVSSSSSSSTAATAAAASSRIGFRTRSEVEVLDDGYKWRKYGKKAVKSSPNPRNYYRCSAPGCGVKKRVERDRHDRRYVVTTYDGVHNHAANAPTPPWSIVRPAAAAAHSSESSF